MADNNKSESPTTESLPVAPSFEPSLSEVQVLQSQPVVDRTIIRIILISLIIGVVGGFVAQGLTRLIGLITNLAFYGHLSSSFISPAGNHLGVFVIIVPVIGGIIVGFMARYGSKGIRGHGIPEAMEQVLTNQSRIQPRLTFLKPISAAIAIGTGGPFGAEGPIIATGGAFGSLLGQLLNTTADERKILLSAGAAAGMAATFGSPVSAVLLAVELLLFEFRPRSLIPVALASVAATAVRIAFVGTKPIFSIPHIAPASSGALIVYIALGAVVGLCAVLVTKSVFKLEDLFAKLPIHWMWWPALGAIAVGVIGYFAPDTLGVGYNVINEILSGEITGKVLIALFILKFISWSIALSSGTSGGTLAPLFTIGGGLGATLGSLVIIISPTLEIDPNVAALVGMAAMFAGASRAFLASVIFAFETTLQPFGLLPLLGGCAAAYLISGLLMRHTIMTEKIQRRGVHVPVEYGTDALEKMLVRDIATYEVVSLKGSKSVGDANSWLDSEFPGSSHQGFPILDDGENLIGVLTRRDLSIKDVHHDTRISELIKMSPHVIYEDNTLRDAINLMAENAIGRLPVVMHSNPRKVIAMVSRSDIVTAYKRNLDEATKSQKSIHWNATR
ncbi:MAG: chloride channel protein [Deltaproteobacteria bacterium]